MQTKTIQFLWDFYEKQWDQTNLTNILHAQFNILSMWVVSNNSTPKLNSYMWGHVCVLLQCVNQKIRIGAIKPQLGKEKCEYSESEPPRKILRFKGLLRWLKTYPKYGNYTKLILWVLNQTIQNFFVKLIWEKG